MNEPMPNVWRELSSRTENDNDMKIGLAVATLILGIVSIAMAIFVTGAIFGFGGAILGAVCLASKSLGKKMAGWGLGLSVIGILLSCFFALTYYSAYVKRLENYKYNGEETSSLDEWIGTKAPDFTVTDVQGNNIKLSDLKGRRLVLNFWSPWWLRDRDAIPHFIKLRKTTSEQELLIIGISTEETEELRGIGHQLGINYPLVSTDDLPSPFDYVYPTPTTFFIDRNGIIQNVLEEYHDFEKIKSLALAPDCEKYDVQEGQVLKSSRISNE